MPILVANRHSSSSVLHPDFAMLRNGSPHRAAHSDRKSNGNTNAKKSFSIDAIINSTPSKMTKSSNRDHHREKSRSPCSSHSSREHGGAGHHTTSSSPDQDLSLKTPSPSIPAPPLRVPMANPSANHFMPAFMENLSFAAAAAAAVASCSSGVPMGPGGLPFFHSQAQAAALAGYNANHLSFLQQGHPHVHSHGQHPGGMSLMNGHRDSFFSPWIGRQNRMFGGPPGLTG